LHFVSVAFALAVEVQTISPRDIMPPKTKKTPTKGEGSSSPTADANVETSTKYSRLSAQENRRSVIVAVLLQIGIRLRYIIESRFWILPIFHDLAEHPSPWRPKSCPK
jgi:hypothetical protein